VQDILIIGQNCTRPEHFVQKYHAGKDSRQIGFVFSTPSTGLGANRNWVCLALFFAIYDRQKTQKHT
jgi:hypothetical protein